MKSAQEAMEEQAELAISDMGYRTCTDKDKFIIAWQACREYYKNCAPGWTQEIESAAESQIEIFLDRFLESFVPLQIALWQHSQDAAALGVARTEIEELKAELLNSYSKGL